MLLQQLCQDSRPQEKFSLASNCKLRLLLHESVSKSDRKLRQTSSLIQGVDLAHPANLTHSSLSKLWSLRSHTWVTSSTWTKCIWPANQHAASTAFSISTWTYLHVCTHTVVAFAYTSYTTYKIAVSKLKHVRVSMQLPQALNHFSNLLSYALETVPNLSKYTTWKTLTFSNSVTAIQWL